MKRFFLPVFICAIATQLAAQGVDADNRPDMDRDRIVFNLHWDGWLNTPDSIKVNAFSRGVGFHFFYDIPLDKKISSVLLRASAIPVPTITAMRCLSRIVPIRLS